MQVLKVIFKIIFVYTLISNTFKNYYKFSKIKKNLKIKVILNLKTFV